MSKSKAIHGAKFFLYYSNFAAPCEYAASCARGETWTSVVSSPTASGTPSPQGDDSDRDHQYEPVFCERSYSGWGTGRSSLGVDNVKNNLDKQDGECNIRCKVVPWMEYNMGSNPMYPEEDSSRRFRMPWALFLKTHPAYFPMFAKFGSLATMKVDGRVSKIQVKVLP